MPGLPEGSQLGQHWAAPAAVAAASATAAAVAATAAAGGPACADWHMGPNTAAAAAGQLLLGKPAPTPLPTWGGGGGGLAGREKLGVYPREVDSLLREVDSLLIYMPYFLVSSYLKN